MAQHRTIQLFTSTGIEKKKEKEKKVGNKGEQNEYNGNSFLSHTDCYLMLEPTHCSTPTKPKASTS